MVGDTEKTLEEEIVCLTETEVEQNELSTWKEQLKISSEEKLTKVKKRLEILKTKTWKDAKTIGLLNTQFSTETIAKKSLRDDVESRQVIECGDQRLFLDYVIETPNSGKRQHVGRIHVLKPWFEKGIFGRLWTARLTIKLSKSECGEAQVTYLWDTG